MKNNKILKSIYISNPCTTSWDKMVGNDQVRFCNECNKNVFNFSEFTKSEVEELIIINKGTVCGKIIKNINGEIITKDRTIKRNNTIKFNRIISTGLALLIGFSTNTFANTNDNKQISFKTDKFSKDSEKTDNINSIIYGTIYDQTKAVISGAEIKITNLRNNEIKNIFSNEYGYYETIINPGEYSITIESLGFQTFHLKTITVSSNEKINISATLSVGIMGEVIVIQNNDKYLYNENIGSIESYIEISPQRKIFNSIIKPFKKLKNLISK